MVGNFLWFIFGGGWLAGLAGFLSGLLMYMTVIGIPWGRSCLVIGRFSLLPFGREAINRKDLRGEADLGTGTLGLLGNVVWFLLAGWWLALGHVGLAISCFLSIIGIPFGIQHLKLAGASLAPVGKTIVPKEVAVEAKRRAASEYVDARRAPSVPSSPEAAAPAASLELPPTAAISSDEPLSALAPGGLVSAGHAFATSPPPEGSPNPGLTHRRLTGHGAGVQGRGIDLGEGVTVGRDQGCDLVLSHDRISRKHAWVGPAGDNVVVRDLGSTNGTHVNGREIQTQPLREGDVIQFGKNADWSFEYRENA